MKNKQLARHRLVIVAIIVVILIITPLFLLHREANQERLDHCLIAAVCNLNVQETLTLLNQGANANCHDNKSAPQNLFETLKQFALRLVSHSSDPNQGPSALQIVFLDPDHTLQAEAGFQSLLPARTTIATALLTHGADPNGFQKDQCPFLIQATVWHMDSVIRLLLAKGAAVDATDGVGDTALVCCRDGDTARLLLQYGANPNTRSNEGFTPLVQECYGYVGTRSLDKIRVLLAAGADANARDTGGSQRDNDGATSLMEAVDDPILVALLLQYGADVNLKDKKGRTALFHAENLDRNEIPIKERKYVISLLRSHGAQNF